MTTQSLGVDAEIKGALTELIMDCPELVELEGRLSQFNIFRVLKADRHEIRHSNMLAWLFSPEETHGLGDRFLRRWLMNTVRDGGPELDATGSFPSPIEIDAVDIEYVEVTREHENIDLLVVITTGTGKTWAICIENKIESSQHSNQLRRYRDYVEHRYLSAEWRLYVFLTKYEEEPEEFGFITSSHELIERVLRSCLNERGDAIGPEPKFLMDQYLKLLAEDFVDDSESAKLARQIYRRHKKAIDFILENRVDPISAASALLEGLLAEKSSELRIVLQACGKGRVRFIPHAWNVPENSGGNAWGPNSPVVVCEVNFWRKAVELQFVLGRAPDAWADRVWARAATAPFKQEWKQRPRVWVKPFKLKSNITIEHLGDADDEEGGKRVFEWLRDEMQKPNFNEAVKVMSGLLTELKQA